MAFQEFTPLEYLKIGIANSYGLDKLLWDERIAWFDENESTIQDIISIWLDEPDEVKKQKLIKEAEEPAMLFAGIIAYYRYRMGQPSGYTVSLDASASGAQLLSVMIGCLDSARLCNVIDTGKREDLYTNVTEAMGERLGGQVNVDRDSAKKAVMTSLYGSKNEPRILFSWRLPDGSWAKTPELEAFYKTMEEDLPGVWELNKALVSIWDPETLSHDWIMPDNFHVKCKVMDKVSHDVMFFGTEVSVHIPVNKPVEFGLSNGANSVHSVDGFIVRELGRRCNYDLTRINQVIDLLNGQSAYYVDTRTRKQKRDDRDIALILAQRFEESGFLSARVLDVICPETIDLFPRDILVELVESLPEEPFEMLAVHDCFRVHPSNGNDIRKQYNRVLHELAHSNILGSILSHLMNGEIEVHKLGDFGELILEANYALS